MFYSALTEFLLDDIPRIYILKRDPCQLQERRTLFVESAVRFRNDRKSPESAVFVYFHLILSTRVKA